MVEWDSLMIGRSPYVFFESFVIECEYIFMIWSRAGTSLVCTVALVGVGVGRAGVLVNFNRPGRCILIDSYGYLLTRNWATPASILSHICTDSIPGWPGSTKLALLQEASIELAALTISCRREGKSP